MNYIPSQILGHMWFSGNKHRRCALESIQGATCWIRHRQPPTGEHLALLSPFPADLFFPEPYDLRQGLRQAITITSEMITF